MLIDTRSQLSASMSPPPPQRATRHVSISSDHATALMYPPPVADDMRFERTHHVWLFCSGCQPGNCTPLSWLSSRAHWGRGVAAVQRAIATAGTSA